MPQYIVKPDRDQNYYVVWSTVVDCPVGAGTRAALMADLRQRDMTAERFARADERGTSADWPGWPKDEMPFGWQDESFLLSEAVPGKTDNGFWLLPRKNLRAFMDAWDDGNEPERHLTWIEWHGDPPCDCGGTDESCIRPAAPSKEDR